MRRSFAIPILVVMASTAMAQSLDTPLVTQDNTTVTLGDVDAALQRLPENDRAGFLLSADRLSRLFGSILRSKQLAQQAVELKLDQDPQVKAQIGYARTEALARVRMEALEKSVAASMPSFDVAAKEQYLVHKADYTTPADVTVQHILISTKDRSETEAKALAEDVRKQALADPAKFEALVEKYSDDPSKTTNKGVIAEASSGKMVPEFAAEAKQLTKIGEISPVVRTQYGYHVLKLVSVKPAHQQSFDEVKAQIVEGLKKDYAAEQRKTFILQLDKGETVVSPDLAHVLAERYHLPENPNAPAIQPLSPEKPLP